MLLQYTGSDGTPQEFLLTENPVSIGRSPDADITVQDDKASRMHCGIRFEKGAYHLKDLQSKNGTYLNDRRVESEKIRSGDRFRIGAIVFRVEEKAVKGPDTAVHEVEEQMADGKGYNTILREIVDTVEPPQKPRPGT